MVMGQSIALSAIKTEVSLDCDDPTNQDLLLQQCGERIEKLSQQGKLSGQGDGVPKAGSRTCVCANTFSLGCGTRRGGRMN